MKEVFERAFVVPLFFFNSQCSIHNSANDFAIISTLTHRVSHWNCGKYPASRKTNIFAATNDEDEDFPGDDDDALHCYLERR